MPAYGSFKVRETPLSDQSKTYDVIWRSNSAPFEYAIVYAAVDAEDAQTRCECLNAALQD